LLVDGKWFVVAEQNKRAEITCDRRVTGSWLPWLRLVTSMGSLVHVIGVKVRVK
jgi:hypothetical protein